MILYFPSIKIIRCDLIPSQREIKYLFYFKSTINSPKHYPNHPLIDGRIEFADSVNSLLFLEHWCEKIIGTKDPKKLKGKELSVLIDFDPNGSKKITLRGWGNKYDKAHYLHNLTCELLPEELTAKLNYDIHAKSIKDKKRVKI